MFAQVDVARLPMRDRFVGVEAFDVADHFVDGAETQLRHVFAQFVRDEHHEVHDVLGLARELLAQHRILRRDADRAGVEMADAHHDASRGDQRGARETEFLGAEQRGDRDVAAGLELAVGLDVDASAQIVHHEGLLRLGESELPRNSRVLDRLQRRRAGAAVVAADQHDVGLGLRDSGGDGADADLGDQLDADARAIVGVLEIVDQLREILDRIDVVMRRRRNQSDAGRRVANLRDEIVDLVAGKLAAFARLRALRHLDLQFVGVDEVVTGDAEARRGDLLDRAAAEVAVRIAHEARGILAALAGVALAADAVHRDGEIFVRLLADRSERHRAGLEALDDLAGRLDFFERYRRPIRIELEQRAQRRERAALLVNRLRVFLEQAEISRAHRMLQPRDRVRVVHVELAARGAIGTGRRRRDRRRDSPPP